MKVVDIILPNYNSIHNVSATINSILKQTYKNWRLIIIDDASNQTTKNILDKFKKKKKIKIFYLKKKKGAFYCRNLAIKKSKGYYLAFIDSDDLWKKNKLKTQINFMEKNNYSFTYTHYTTFNSSDKNLRDIRVPNKFNFDTFTKNTSIATSSMIVRRSKVLKLKFIATKICEDYFYKCQLLKKIGYAYCCPEFLTKYQIRKNSLQSNKFKNVYWMWKINKKFNHFNILKNLISIFFISFHSLRKYGIK